MRSDLKRASGLVLLIHLVAAGCGGGGDGENARFDARRIDARESADAAGDLPDGPLDVDATDVDSGGPGVDADADDTDIRDLQNGSVAMGTAVRVAGVVVTARTDSATGSSSVIFLQEPTGAPEYSGIFVFVDLDPAPAFAMPDVGDVVTLDGTVNEFERAGLPGARTNLDPVTNITVTGVGTVPDPVVLTEAELTTGATTELWEGVLVRVEDATVQSRDAFGQVTLGGGLIVDDRMYPWTQPYPGDTYTSLTGVMDWDFGAARLYPRSAADLAGHVAADPRVVSLTPTTATVAEGGSVELTVTLDRPAPTGGHPVDLSSSSPSSAAVEVAVIVPEGATTATFPADAIAAGPATITATSGGASQTSMITVVTGGGPLVTSIVGVTGIMRNGGTGVAIVTLDRAAPAGGTIVTLSSSVVASVIVPATVTVPVGLTEATFGVEGGATAGASVIGASTPDGGATAMITARATALAPTVDQLVINEVLYDPPGTLTTDLVGDASCDGQRTDGDEFIELYNVTTEPLNLAGVSIWDNVGTAPAVPTYRVSFPVFELGPGESVVVFSGTAGVTGTSPWCATVAGAGIGDAAAFSGGAFQLNNTGDTIAIRATAEAGSTLLAGLAYVSGAASDQSFTRDPDGFGLYATHDTVAGHAPDRAFTPGTLVTGLPWASVRP